MKKLYIAAIAVFAMGLVSCGSKKEEPVEAESVPVEDVIEAPATDDPFEALNTDDPEALEENIDAITDQIEDLYEEGKVEEATSYLERLQTWYTANKEKVKKFTDESPEIESLMEKAQTLKERYSESAAELKSKAKEAIDDAKEKYGDDAREAAEEVVEKVKKAADSEEVKRAKEKGKAAAEEAKEKGKAAAKEAAGRLRDALKK